MENEDANEILLFDPRGVVITLFPEDMTQSVASSLAPLGRFATRLRHYVHLAIAANTRGAVAPPTNNQVANVRDRADANALLNYDFAAAVMRQIGNTPILNRLAQFANDLEHYIDLANQADEGQGAQQPQEAVADPVPSAPQPDAAPIEAQNNGNGGARGHNAARPDAARSEASNNPTGGSLGGDNSAVRPDAAPSAAPPEVEPAPAVAVSPTNSDHSVANETEDRENSVQPDAVQSHASPAAALPEDEQLNGTNPAEDIQGESENFTPATTERHELACQLPASSVGQGQQRPPPRWLFEPQDTTNDGADAEAPIEPLNPADQSGKRLEIQEEIINSDNPQEETPMGSSDSADGSAVHLDLPGGHDNDDNQQDDTPIGSWDTVDGTDEQSDEPEAMVNDGSGSELEAAEDSNGCTDLSAEAPVAAPHPGMLLARNSAITRSRAALVDHLMDQALSNDGESPDAIRNIAENEEGRSYAETTATDTPSSAVTKRADVKQDDEIIPDRTKSKKRRRMLLEKAKRKKAKKEKVTEEELPPLPEAPKIEAPPGYKGTLSQSKLKHSVGLPRAVLNKHIEDLGLSVKFGMPVVSSKTGKISHLTLNSHWNELPYTEDQTLKFWLGEGLTRLRQTAPLDPANNPGQSPVPIFFAQPKKGGARCHYVGHFLCVTFDTTENAKVMLKGKRRQALLEFKLVKFKQELADKMSNIANDL